MPICPHCGGEIGPVAMFCNRCGIRTSSAEGTHAPAGTVVTAVLTRKLVEVVTPAPVGLMPMGRPFLRVVDSGVQIPLPAGGEILIGREDPVSGIYPEINLTPYGGEEGGVSRRHAKIIVKDGTFFVEDVDSTNFTFVNKHRLIPRVPHSLKDGDELRCGRMVMTFHTG